MDPGGGVPVPDAVPVPVPDADPDPVPVPPVLAEAWRRHVVRQLKLRDRTQSSMFQDLTRFYTRILERTSLTKGILSGSARLPSADGSALSLQQQNFRFRKITGELAYQVVELQQQIKIKDGVLEKQRARLEDGRLLLDACRDTRQDLQVRVERVRRDMGTLKVEYDALLQRQREAESRLREEKMREEHLREKKQADSGRAREVTMQKELPVAARSKLLQDPLSTVVAPKPAETPDESGGHRETRLFRSASVASSRIRGFFQKRRGHSVCSLEEDFPHPVGICVYARVPVRALQALEAHEQGINTVRFSCSSDLLATGGTDRVIKLWALRRRHADAQGHAGREHGGRHLRGVRPHGKPGSDPQRSGGGELRGGVVEQKRVNTPAASAPELCGVPLCLQGRRVLAASFDRSALLWRLGDSSPKVTLTGHSRKVTAARFTTAPHQVVTGSADRTVRLWDLQRAACVRQVETPSFCSDLVCSENCIVSGHFDSKIRVWDGRLGGCIQELPSQGRVTSLDLSYDRRQVLSCCRDDSLQLLDLRRWSHNRAVFRAEGFKCGSDSTKAVISPDSSYAAAGSADGSVFIWRVATAQLETRLLQEHSSPVNAVSWSLSAQYVVSVDKSRWAVLWSGV